MNPESSVGEDFRVDLGGCPPRPPTDPYVRNYRIRFLRSRVRYAIKDTLTRTLWVGKPLVALSLASCAIR